MPMYNAPIPRIALATLMASLPTSAGQEVFTNEGQEFVSAINPYDASGFYWKPKGHQRVINDVAVTTGLKQTTQQIIKSISILAGLFYCQRVLLEWEIGKTGTTDVAAQNNMRLGPLGTTADPYLLQSVASAVLAAGKRSLGYSAVYEFNKTGGMKRGSGGGSDNGSFNNVTSGTALSLPASTGLDLTVAQILTLDMSMAAATTDSPQIGGFYATLIP